MVEVRKAMEDKSQISSRKATFVFRFAGAFVGSTVATARSVARFGVGCGKRAADLCEAGVTATGEICGRGVVAKKRILGRSVEPSPGEAPVQAAEPRVIAPVPAKPRMPARPQARVEAAAPRAIAPVPAKPRMPARPEAPVEAAEPRVIAPVPARRPAPPAKAVAKKSPPAEAPADVRRPAAPAPTPVEVDAAAFGSMAQKVRYKKALSDLAVRGTAMRLQAAKALGGIRHALSVRALAARFFEEPSAQVRKGCLNALAKLEMQEAAPVMEHALRDGSEAVRLVAVMGAYRLAGAGCAPALTGMLDDGNAEVRRMAARCLGWTGQAAVAVKLAPILGDENPRVRRTVAEAMGSLGNRSVVSTLIECLDDPDDLVRRKVLEALERITGKRMGKRHLKNEETHERLQAQWRHWWQEHAEG